MMRHIWKPSLTRGFGNRRPSAQTREDGRRSHAEEDASRNIEPLETSEEEEDEKEDEDEEDDFVLPDASQDDVEWDIENEEEAELKRRWERFESPQQGDDKASLLREFLDLFIETYLEWYPLRHLPHKSIWRSDSHTSLTEVDLGSYHQDEELMCHEHGTEQIALPGVERKTLPTRFGFPRQVVQGLFDYVTRSFQCQNINDTQNANPRSLGAQSIEFVTRLCSDEWQGDSSNPLKKEETMLDLLRALSICARFFHCRQLLEKFGIMDYFLSMLRKKCSEMNHFVSEVLVPHLQSSNPEESFPEFPFQTQRFISIQSQMIHMLDVILSMFGNVRGTCSDTEKKQQAKSQEMSKLIKLGSKSIKRFVSSKKNDGLRTLLELLKVLESGRNLSQEHEEAFKNDSQPESLAKTEPAINTLDPITEKGFGTRSFYEHSSTDYKSVSESHGLFCVLDDMDELEGKVLKVLHTILLNHRKSKKRFLSQGGMDILLGLLRRKTTACPPDSRMQNKVQAYMVCLSSMSESQQVMLQKFEDGGGLNLIAKLTKDYLCDSLLSESGSLKMIHNRIRTLISEIELESRITQGETVKFFHDLYHKLEPAALLQNSMLYLAEMILELANVDYGPSASGDEASHIKAVVKFSNAILDGIKDFMKTQETVGKEDDCSKGAFHLMLCYLEYIHTQLATTADNLKDKDTLSNVVNDIIRCGDFQDLTVHCIKVLHSLVWTRMNSDPSKLQNELDLLFRVIEACQLVPKAFALQAFEDLIFKDDKLIFDTLHRIESFKSLYDTPSEILDNVSSSDSPVVAAVRDTSERISFRHIDYMLQQRKLEDSLSDEAYKFLISSACWFCEVESSSHETASDFDKMSKIVELLFDIMKALYKIEKSKSITKARKLHELLARLQTLNTEKRLRFVTHLLRELRSLCMREESFKEVVAEADLFGPLVGLLAVCEESPERNQSEASAEVVVTVLDIMSNCTAATNKFETQVGYELWSRLIVDRLNFIGAQGYEYEKVVNNLGDATLRLSSPSGDHNSKMVTVFVKILMRLYQNLRQGVSTDGTGSSSKRDAEIISRLQPLVIKNLNIVKETLEPSQTCVIACRQNQLWQVLLAWLSYVGKRGGESCKVTKVLVELVQICGRTGVSCPDLKRCFRIFSNKDIAANIKVSLLDALSDLSKSMWPSSLFSFTGIKSGIAFPQKLEWDCNKGYTFITWIRRESSAASTRRGKGTETALYYIADRSRTRIVVSLVDKSIFVRINGPKEFEAYSFRNQCISSQNWIHLAIVHHFNYPVGNKGRFVVYINGIEAEQKEVIRLSGSVKIVKGHVGCGEPIVSESREYTIEPFKGLMSTVYFFDDVKTPDQIARFYQYNCRALGSGESHAELRLPLNSTDLVEKIKFILEPTTLKTGNDSSVTRLPGGEVGSSILHNTVQYIRSDISNSFRSLGGVQTLFPFFSRDVLKSYTEPQQLSLLRSVVGLISSQVSASDSVRTYLKDEGVHILEYYLNSLPPRLLRSDLFIDISDLCTKAKESGDLLLWKSLRHHLLYNTRKIWLRSEYFEECSIMCLDSMLEQFNFHKEDTWPVISVFDLMILAKGLWSRFCGNSDSKPDQRASEYPDEMIFGCVNKIASLIESIIYERAHHLELSEAMPLGVVKEFLSFAIWWDSDGLQDKGSEYSRWCRQYISCSMLRILHILIQPSENNERTRMREHVLVLLDQSRAGKFLSSCSLTIKKRIANGATLSEKESKTLHEIQTISVVTALCLMTTKMSCSSGERVAEGLEGSSTFYNAQDLELLDDVLGLSQSLELDDELQVIITSLLASCSHSSQGYLDEAQRLYSKQPSALQPGKDLHSQPTFGTDLETESCCSSEEPISFTSDKLSEYIAAGPFNAVIAVGFLVHFNDEGKKCDILQNITTLLIEDIKSRTGRIAQCFLELKQSISWQKVLLLIIEQVVDSESTNLEYLSSDKSMLASLVRRLFCTLHVFAVFNYPQGWQHMEATAIQLMADAENKKGLEYSMTAFTMEDFLREILFGRWNKFSTFTEDFNDNIAATFTMANRILLRTHPFGEVYGTEIEDSAHLSYSAEADASCSTPPTSSDGRVSRIDEYVMLGSEKVEEDKSDRKGDHYEHLAELCRLLCIISAITLNGKYETYNLYLDGDEKSACRLECPEDKMGSSISDLGSQPATSKFLSRLFPNPTKFNKSSPLLSYEDPNARNFTISDWIMKGSSQVSSLICGPLKLFPSRLLAVSLSCANLIDAKRDETLKACLLDISLEFYAKATNTSIQQKAPHFDDTRSIVDDHHLLLSWLGDRLREDASIKPGVESEGHTSSIFELAARRIRSLSQDAMHSYFFSMYQIPWIRDGPDSQLLPDTDSKRVQRAHSEELRLKRENDETLVDEIASSMERVRTDREKSNDGVLDRISGYSERVLQAIDGALELSMRRKWSSLCHQLFSERALWASYGNEQSKDHCGGNDSDNSGAVSNKWAVDKGENSQRRRTRVVPDSNLVLHNEDLVWLELESRLKNSLLSHQDSKLNQAKSNSLVAEYNVDSESVDELDYPDFRKATYREPSPILRDGVLPKETTPSVINSEECYWITSRAKVHGFVELASKHLKFVPVLEDDTNSETYNRWGSSRLAYKWELAQMKEIFESRYLHQRNAIEISFYGNEPRLLLKFESQKKAIRFSNQIVFATSSNVSYRPNVMRIPIINKSRKRERARKLSEIWSSGCISNFEYLMELNTLAGRSYNDLSQYPVFPWILKDYTSESIDLMDPSVYRDLSKPIGAQNPERLKIFQDRYESLRQLCESSDSQDIDVIPQFHYGSHYSSLAIATYYLIRLEPFYSLHREIQGGKIDHADRLFSSIAECWNNCLTNTSDVKELVPEFFYQSEFLRNNSKFDLGTKQNGSFVDDVILPQWANGSPEKFIEINRAALESPIVSASLHHWVDLVFGYKQLGLAAEEANNVFYYLTYEEEATKCLEKEEDPLQRASVETQILEFGQTPMQLFENPHPPRRCAIARPLSEEGSRTRSKAGQNEIIGNEHSHASDKPSQNVLPALNGRLSDHVLENIAETVRYKGYKSHEEGENLSEVLYLEKLGSHCLVIYRDSSVVVYQWCVHHPPHPYNENNSRYHKLGAKFDERRKIPLPVMHPMAIPQRCLGVISSSRKFGAIVVGGMMDGALSVIPFQSLMGEQAFNAIADNCEMFSHYSGPDPVERRFIKAHSDAITCLSVSTGGRMVATGSLDTTVMIWDSDSLVSEGPRPKGVGRAQMPASPRHVLQGHDDVVTVVEIVSELDLVISGSRDNTLILFSLTKGMYLQTLDPLRDTGARPPAIFEKFERAADTVQDELDESHEGIEASTDSALSAVKAVTCSKPFGLIVLYTKDLKLLTYTVNGRLIKSRDSNQKLIDIMAAPSLHEYALACAGVTDFITVRNIFTLEIMRTLKFEGSVTRDPVIRTWCITEEGCIITGVLNGNIVLVSADCSKKVARCY